jgi:hypothetical protein
MDPAIVQQAANATNDPAITAGLLALAIAMAEIIKQGIGMIAKKFGKQKDTVILKLDPQASQIINDTEHKVTEIRGVVMRADADGNPLIYSNRSTERTIERMGELMKDLATYQQKLAESMTRLDARFEAHDRNDAVTFSKLVDAQERLELIANANKDNVIEIKRDHNTLVSRIDQILSKLS